MILYLTPFFPPNVGGAESFAKNLCDEAKKWFHITVLTFQPFNQKADHYEEYYYKRGSLKIFRMLWLFRQNTWEGESIKNFISVFPSLLIGSFWLNLRKKYRIIHAHGLLSGLVAVILKRFFKCKVYITLLALYDFRSGLLARCARFIFKNCDLAFVEGSNGMANIMGLIDESKVRKFTHWCNQTKFKPVNRMNNKIRVLFVGRPLRQKGKHIVQGTERLLNNPKYEFIYVENVKQEDLPKYYQMAHVVCVPSLYAEGHTRVVIEAASCGCIILASNKGSLPEQIGDFGKCVEPTPENFAFQIERFGKGYGLRALKYAREHFSNKNAEVFLNEYD